MDASSSQYSRELRKAVRHANRLSKVLVQFERDRRGGPWLVGRSAELRAVVSCSVADWRAGAVDHDRALAAITSYVDNLHRSAAERLRCGHPFECCAIDEALTVVPGDDVATATSLVSILGAELTDAATVRTGWVDGPEVLERFRSELARVEIHARMLARRLGTRCVTMDDLRGFGREGLLDAARSFDKRHGVPFSHWAALRTRNAMIDGVRSWGGLPRRMMRQLQALEAGDVGERGRNEQDGDGKLAANGADEAVGVRLTVMAPGEGVRRTQEEPDRLGASPEDVVANAELRILLRNVVAKLPDRERQVVEGYYFAGQTLKEVGAAAGATESWASRVLERAVERLHRGLRRCEGVAVSQARTAPKS